MGLIAHSCIGLLAVLLVAAVSQPAAAKDGKPKNAQEKRDNERVRDAQKDVENARDKLNDAQKDLKEAEQALRQAEAREKAATKAIETVRDKVEARLGQMAGLDEALADLKEAQAAFDQAKAPVLEKLRTDSEYLAVVQRGKDAMETLKELRANRDPAGNSQRQRISELTKLTLAPAQWESEAVASNPAAKSAREKLSGAQTKLSALRERIRKDVENDREVKAAVADAESARKEVRTATASAGKERAQFAQAQQTLAQRQAELQRAQVRDKRNDGKKK